MSSGVERKLTTILSADAEGYSREMAADEVRALGALQAARGVFAKFIERRRGRIANTAGDGLLAEFPSVVEAVQCAIEVQRELGGRGQDPACSLRFRIGIHLGDVMIDGQDLLGEGVNLAARLQSMAEPGGILISRQVYDQVHAKLSVSFEYLGEKRPKNLSEQVAVYSVALDGKPRSAPHEAAVPEKPSPPPPPPEAEDLAPADLPADLKARVLHRGKLLAGIWAILATVDLLTGSGFWAHWPGIAMASAVAWDAAPLFVRGWFSVQYARGVVILATLAVINLLTSSYPWVIWPAFAMVAIALIRRLSASPH